MQPTRRLTDYDTYVFDLDGTLLSTLGDLAASTNHALRANGMPERTLDEVRRFVGNGVKKLMERAIQAGSAIRFSRKHTLTSANITCTTISTPPGPIRASWRC